MLITQRIRKFVMVLVFLASAILFPSGGQVLADCRTTDCDPDGSSCQNDAVTVEVARIYEGDLYVGNVELRWSASCQTNWARLNAVASGDVQVALWTDNKVACVLQYTVSATSGGYRTLWTKMYKAPTGRIYASAQGRIRSGWEQTRFR